MPKSASRRGDLYVAASKRRQSEPRGVAATARSINMNFEDLRRSSGLQSADRMMAGVKGSPAGDLAAKQRRDRARKSLKKQGY